MLRSVIPFARRALRRFAPAQPATTYRWSPPVPYDTFPLMEGPIGRLFRVAAVPALAEGSLRPGAILRVVDRGGDTATVMTLNGRRVALTGRDARDVQVVAIH